MREEGLGMRICEPTARVEDNKSREASRVAIGNGIDVEIRPISIHNAKFACSIAPSDDARSSCKNTIVVEK